MLSCESENGGSAQDNGGVGSRSPIGVEDKLRSEQAPSIHSATLRPSLSFVAKATKESILEGKHGREALFEVAKRKNVFVIFYAPYYVPQERHI